jgi:3-dehydroquinate synthase
MQALKTDTYSVYFSAEAYQMLNEHLNERKYSKVFLLTDSNTLSDCKPYFKNLVAGSEDWTSITIPAGEDHKNIESCTYVWEELSANGADRKSLLINLGGGVVTDLGGFVASTYQRGINFINIPTTLLAMVDASVGGKTGVDLGTLKNQIGVINQPEMVLVDPGYLKTLSQRQLTSGFAEMLKHGLIQDDSYWNSLIQIMPESVDDNLIHISVAIKNRVVQEDPTEQNLRKILNFGHTLGHAVESYFLNASGQEPLLHGEAIAIGMILEAFLSTKVAGLSKAACDEIKTAFLTYYPKVKITKTQQNKIVQLLRFDKKNSHGTIYFSLLEKIGVACYNKEVSDEIIDAAFEYYDE